MIKVIATGALRTKLLNMSVWELETYSHKHRMGVTMQGEDVVLEYE